MCELSDLKAKNKYFVITNELYANLKKIFRKNSKKLKNL